MINILKKDLERLYIDEEKSLIEISKIYECNRETVKNRLNKYEIPIRPHGAFLVDSDGNTLKSKYNKGEICWSEYGNKWTKSKGFKNDAEYNRKMRYKRGVGTGLSMCENKDCTAYLGVYIAERILPKIFDNVEMKPYGYPGYDAICSRDLKIQVKSSCLHKNNSWVFNVKKNKIADYFFMVAFDNRDDLNVMRMWLIKGSENIKTYGLYVFDGNLNE